MMGNVREDGVRSVLPFEGSRALDLVSRLSIEEEFSVRFFASMSGTWHRYYVFSLRAGNVI
jgi:hypothetical protein